MASKQQRARVGEQNSVFPAEPASFCSRPTPVVPSNPELCADERSGMRQHDSERPAARPPFPSASISDRPTFVPDDYVEPRLESPPSVTVEEAASDETLEPASPLETPVRFTPPMPSPQFAAPSAPHAATVRPRARRPRVVFARILFVVLFGAVGSLLGYAFRPELALALGHLRGGEHATTSVK